MGACVRVCVLSHTLSLSSALSFSLSFYSSLLRSPASNLRSHTHTLRLAIVPRLRSLPATPGWRLAAGGVQRLSDGSTIRRGVKAYCIARTFGVGDGCV